MSIVTAVLLPLDQKNAGGLWLEDPSVADQADNLDDGVETNDGDLTKIFTSFSGRYVTLQLGNIPLIVPPATPIPLSTPLNKIKIGFAGKYTETIGNPIVEFRVYISGQQATPVLAVDFESFVLGNWTKVEGETLGDLLLAPWTDMTVGEWNAENDAGPPGCRIQAISNWSGTPSGDHKPYEPPGTPI